MTHNRNLIALLALMLLIVAGAVITPRVLAAGDYAAEVRTEVIRFDVAEDGTRFLFDEAPVFEEDGMPAYGNPFVTQGYIYPAGTLSCDDEGCNGVLDNGEPEFPDLVIGEWTCKGYMIGDGAHTTSGPWVISTQVYNFGEEYGTKTIVTEGYELADLNASVTRAITGGTGPYKLARGEQRQTLLGFHPVHMGVALQVEVEVRTR
jgi:hypothetical protein